jgi:hypothetical protein
MPSLVEMEKEMKEGERYGEEKHQDLWKNLTKCQDFSKFPISLPAPISGECCS